MSAARATDHSLVAADIGLHQGTPIVTGWQMTEVAIAVASLNHMLELGRPVYVRLT